jgi:hypothetical protein
LPKKAKKQLKIFTEIQLNAAIRWTFLINIHDLASYIYFRMVDFTSSLSASRVQIITVPLTVPCSLQLFFHKTLFMDNNYTVNPSQCLLYCSDNSGILPRSLKLLVNRKL